MAGLFLCFGSLPQTANAVEVRGDDWRVLYNLPDGSSFRGYSDDEFELRDLLVDRLKQLGARDEATLTTFTFSGNETGAGRLMYEMERALKRGARVRFITDRKEDTAETFTNNTDRKPRSLKGLAEHERFTLAVDGSEGGIMHHKFALFDYSGSGMNAGQKILVTSSFNLTGASSFQWNISLELSQNILYGAFHQEAEELLAGRFHRDPAKSHAHDNRLVQLKEGTARVRFGPSPKLRPIGDMLEAGLRAAKKEVVFSLNFIADDELAHALVATAKRGVKVVGCVALSEGKTKGPTKEALKILRAEPKIEWVEAFEAHGEEARDSGKSQNLVHTKYVVIDRTWVLHGSANWTASALRDENENDENVVNLRHPKIAAAFLQQFEAMTGHKTE